jgi:hypothetical protein
MVIFHSYVSLPEGILWNGEKPHEPYWYMYWFFPILSLFWIFLEATRHQYEAFEVNVDSLPSLGVSDHSIPAN